MRFLTRWCVIHIVSERDATGLVALDNAEHLCSLQAKQWIGLDAGSRRGLPTPVGQRLLLNGFTAVLDPNRVEARNFSDKGTRG
jgi:hypothetical protein